MTASSQRRMAATLLALASMVACDGGGPPPADALRTPERTRAPSPTTSPSHRATASPVAETAPRPKTWVGIDENGRLVVVGRDGGLRRVLAEYDVPGECPEKGEPLAGCSFVVELAITPDGKSVYYEVCCEPAPDVIYMVPRTGGGSKRVAYGAFPAIDGTGDRLAFVELQWVALKELGGGEPKRYESDDPPLALEGMTWSADGSKLAFGLYDDDGRGRVRVLTLDGAASLDDAEELPAPGNKTWRLPVFLRDGTLVVVQQRAGAGFGPGRGARMLVVDAETGEVLDRFDAGGPVLSLHVDVTGSYLIYVLADGSVHWRALDGRTRLLASGGFTAAAW